MLHNGYECFEYMKDCWPEAEAVERNDSLPEYLKRLRENPQLLETLECQSNFVEDIRPTDGGIKYCTDYDLAEISVERNMSQQPSDSDILSYWTPRVALGCSVQLKSYRSVNVSLLVTCICEEHGMRVSRFADEKYKEVANPVWLARVLAHATYDILKKSGFAQQYEAQFKASIMPPTKRNHKEEDVGGNVQCFVKQCGSVRPAYVMENSDDPPTELMHLYHPMGLGHQHDVQSSLLDRFADFRVAAAFTKALSLLSVGFHRDIVCSCIPTGAHRHGTPAQSLSHFLQRVKDLQVAQIENVEWQNVLDVFKVDEETLLTALNKMSSFDWTEKVNGVLEVVRQQSSGHVAIPARAGRGPTVKFRVEKSYAQVPPTLLTSDPPEWRGRLYLTGSSAVTSPDWMVWAGTTHVINTLGKYGENNVITPEYDAAYKNRLPNVRYHDWPINAVKERLHYQAVFRSMAKALESADTVLVAHCKNGKHRSAFVCYSFLRFWYGYDHSTAMSLLDARVDIYGNPLFTYEYQKIDAQEWLTSIWEVPFLETSSFIKWTKGGSVNDEA